jgi:hypothetical protein
VSNPTTFLQLCQRTARECGVAGVGPTSVDGQVGELSRIVNWVEAAYSDVQSLHIDWDLFWGEDNLDLTSNVGSYSAPYVDNNVSRFDGPLFLFDTNIGDADKSILEFVPYREFRTKYMHGERIPNRPTKYTVAPNESAILFDPIPNLDTYRVNYTYFRDTHTLSANTDTTLLPEKHTMAIVWRATMLYAQYEEAVNLYKLAEAQYQAAIKGLRESHLPKREILMRPIA